MYMSLSNLAIEALLCTLSQPRSLVLLAMNTDLKDSSTTPNPGDTVLTARDTGDLE